MKKEHPKTPSQILFEGKQLINERPEDMPYADYRMMRAHQTALLRVIHAKTPNNKIQQSMGIKVGYNQHKRFK